MIGFAFRNIHTSHFTGLVVKTVTNPLLPNKRVQRISVPGRDGQYIFEDGYDNKQLEFQCTLTKGSIVERRLRAREIASWLSGTGDLVLDGESGKVYKVIKTVSDVSLAIEQVADTFNITFETEPFQLGDHKTITADNPIVIELVNSGSMEAETILAVTGTGDVTLALGTQSLTLSGLNGKVNLDSKRMLVFTDDLQNMANLHNGGFIKVPPGTSSLSVTGTVSQITVDYYDTYL